ncbi:Nucleoporin NUP188 [Fusarium oxysporum f. sp. cubense]|uniref:Nucleoporin NUP188 n=1 Tax=Fusarium oxysporum f. sp. cubense TaxID=61366 RepID=A0A559KVS4_FUSOC|nr:Nucleoporin NUP188 [Fusarium oxysporum f. sp. cubense]
MAPVADRIYFPSLEQCLTGERVLLSWKLIATALSDISGQRTTSSAVIEFLSDDYVHRLLEDPASTFAPADEATKKVFETKTAPINVPASSDGRPDIESIKKDAEWLSKNAKINLVAALRVVVIEHQSRPARHLSGPLSSQDAKNLQEAAGLNNGQGSGLLLDLGSAAALDAEEIWTEFEKPETRQRRLFDTYLTERRFFMMSADYANSIKLYERLPTFASVDLDLAKTYRLKLPSRDDAEPLLPTYLQVLTDSMSRIESGLKAVTDEKWVTEEVELDWLRTLLTEAIHALSVVFQIVDSFGDDFAPSTAVNQWFSLMEVYRFFDAVQPIHESIAPLVLPLKTLSAAVSLILLKPARSLTYLSEREEDATQADTSYDTYLLSSDVLEQVHKSILNAAEADCESASPVIFAWTLLLHRMNVSYQSRTEKRDNLLQQNARETFEAGGVVRPVARRNSAGSIFSIESSKFDGFLENATSSKDLVVVEQLASQVTAQGRVFDVVSNMATALGPSDEGSMTPLLSARLRNVFLELLKVSYPIVGYQSEPVSSLLSILSAGRNYWDISNKENLSEKQDILASMVNDDLALEFFFQQALDRYPYEFLPFITLCRTLASATSLRESDRSQMILNLLRATPTLTFVLPDYFQEYELAQEDENTNTFCLLQDIPIISLSPSWRGRRVEDDAYRIPAGTYGRFVTDTGRVVSMEYPHSTISLLGRRLEINLMKEGYQSELGMLQPEETAEVISLFATLIRMDHLNAAGGESTGALVFSDNDILHEAKKHIDAGSGRDLLTVVCETMDYYMQVDLAESEDVVVTILNSCVQFLDAILPIYPSRVWSYLSRCELLSSESRAGKLTKVVGSLDLVQERLEFLLSCLRLFSNLIDTAMTSAVQRRAGIHTTSRNKSDLNPWLGTADKVLAKVSYAIAQAGVDIFENTSTWRFASDTCRSSVLREVVPILQKVIMYSYSLGDPSTSENLTSCLRPAASYVIDCFVSPSTGSLRFQPLLSSLITAFTTADSTLYPRRVEMVQAQLNSVLEFSATLLRVANYLEQSSSMIETYLFKSSTLLARLCAVSDHFRKPTMWLLESLVVNAGKSSSEPPSLLGYLGPQISKSFLQLLSILGKPFELRGEVKATWKFFSAILRNRQQWMSNCLLTGQTPREAMKKDKKKTDASSSSVFATGLAKLGKLKDLEISEALVILDFVASAQNFWPWTVFTLQKDTAYLDGLREYVRDLKSSSITVKSDPVRAAFDARLAAYIAETFAMQLYHSRHLGNSGTLAKSLVGDLDYYLRDGVEVGGYNKSLHNNFARNFSNKYSDCPVDCFKRTILEPRELGKSYYYDLERADQMLRFDPGWKGRKDDGFKTEMERANTNLSLVDAQLALFHAWEFLLVELSTCMPKNDTVEKQMLQVAQQCLNANQGVPGPEHIFLKLVGSRASLALVLIQRLVKSSVPVKDINQLLSTLVGTMNGVEEPWGTESISYYRTLLKALFVTLRAYQISGKKATESQDAFEGTTVTVTQTVLNILDRVVGRGFRALVSLIHDNENSVSPEDLGLLTAILQACISLPNMDQSQTQVLNIMAEHQVLHAASSLYSWADRLADQGDPIYGELSMLFLLELSTLPMVAEQMACDGILSNILSANLTKFMLKSNISPYSDSPVVQRCYGIWAKGLLPLMLNLLTALGATVAPEVAYVLNQFPHLLEASVDRFEAPGASRTQSRASPHYLTLVAISEVHSLALLTRVLAALRVNNNRDIPDVEWDSANLLENVDFWLSTKKLLKERLMPLGQREMDWRGMKPATGAYDSLLEEKAVAQLDAIRDVLSEEADN